jgi:hypothetical protein
MTKSKNELSTVLQSGVVVISLFAPFFSNSANSGKASVFSAVKTLLLPPIISYFNDTYKAEFAIKVGLNAVLSSLVTNNKDHNANLYDRLLFFTVATICDAAFVGIKYSLSDDIQNNEISQDLEHNAIDSLTSQDEALNIEKSEEIVMDQIFQELADNNF